MFLNSIGRNKILLRCSLISSSEKIPNICLLALLHIYYYTFITAYYYYYYYYLFITTYYIYCDHDFTTHSLRVVIVPRLRRFLVVSVK